MSSLIKRKLVFKTRPSGQLQLSKTVNTTEFGVPNQMFDKADVDEILKKNTRDVRNGTLVVEIQ